MGMKTGRAILIFSDIKNPGFREKEKALAIYKVLGMPTHNGVTKDKMLEVIRWLWDQLYEYNDNQRKLPEPQKEEKEDA